MGEWLHTAAKPRLDGRKRNANITPLDRLGAHRNNRHGSMKKRTARKFSRASLKSRSWPYRQRSASRNHTPQIFERVGVAPIHGIGRRSHGSLASRQLCEATK